MGYEPEWGRDSNGVCLGLPDHGQRRTILDRTGGVVAFQFDQYRVGGGAGQALQTHQRGIADKCFDGWETHGP